MRIIKISMFIVFLISTMVYSQYSNPRQYPPLTGVMDTNYFHLSFYTDGQVSGILPGIDVRGSWLKDGNDYIGDMTPMIGLQLPAKDYTGDGKVDKIHSVIISRGPRNRQSEERHPTLSYFWGWNEKPGYRRNGSDKVPMSNDPGSWPETWPDHPEWENNVWNGLYGPNTFAGDLEAYFRMDDFWDDEFNLKYKFYPNPSDTSIKGHGLNVGVRFIQSKNPLFEDMIFRIYDIKNESEHDYNNMFWGNIAGTLSGGDGDSQDDLAYYNLTGGTVYSWDSDSRGNRGQIVGYMGEVLIQTPGNPYDGIDNDNDSKSNSPRFTADDFKEIIYNAGDKIVLIDPVTFERTLYTVKSTIDTVFSMGIPFVINPGVSRFREGHIAQFQTNDADKTAIPDKTATDGIDNDLDGLIDENESLYHYVKIMENSPALSYKNYITGEGLSDEHIDEGLIDPNEIDEVGMGSFDWFHLVSSPSMDNDEGLWSTMTPGRFDVNTPALKDGDYIYGTNYFSIKSGETKRVVNAIIMAKDYAGFKQKSQFAKLLWDLNFDLDSLKKNVTFTNLNKYEKFIGIKEITWQSNYSQGTADLWFSPDAGDTWKVISENVPNSGSFSWNTENVSDCSFGIIRIFVKDTKGNLIGYNDSQGKFIIDNEENGTPFFRILNKNLGGTDPVTGKTIDLNLLVGDPEETTLTASLYFSSESKLNYVLYQTFDINTDSIPFIQEINIENMPNTENASIKIVVSDGVNSYSDSTGVFIKRTERYVVNPWHVQKLSGYSEVPYQINVVDSTKLTGDEYLITFTDTTFMDYKKKFSVYNLTTNEIVLENVYVVSKTENVIFDGMGFYNEDVTTQIDTAKSGWAEKPPFNIAYVFYKNNESLDSRKANNGYPLPNDYKIVFYDSNVDTTEKLQLLPTSNPANQFNSIPVNFKVFNTTRNEQIKVAAKIASTSMTKFMSIIFLEDIAGRELKTWSCQITSLDPNTWINPGNTLYLSTLKGFSIYDSIKVSGVVSNVHDKNITPMDFALYQNFPNPFNPSTTIKFDLPVSDIVQIKVYDILGREITTLVNEFKNAGKYDLRFDASNLASGIYVYQIKAGKFIQSKKMMLVK